MHVGGRGKQEILGQLRSCPTSADHVYPIHPCHANDVARLCDCLTFLCNENSTCGTLEMVDISCCYYSLLILMWQATQFANSQTRIKKQRQRNKETHFSPVALLWRDTVTGWTVKSSTFKPLWYNFWVHARLLRIFCHGPSRDIQMQKEVPSVLGKDTQGFYVQAMLSHTCRFQMPWTGPHPLTLSALEGLVHKLNENQWSFPCSNHMRFLPKLNQTSQLLCKFKQYCGPCATGQYMWCAWENISRWQAGGEWFWYSSDYFPLDLKFSQNPLFTQKNHF